MRLLFFDNTSCRLFVNASLLLLCMTAAGASTRSFSRNDDKQQSLYVTEQSGNNFDKDVSKGLFDAELEKLNEIQSTLNQAWDTIASQISSIDGIEVVADEINSKIDVVLVDDQTVIADVATVQATVDTINTKVTTVQTKVNQIASSQWPITVIQANANTPIVISNPGTYCLAANVRLTSGAPAPVITIQVKNVVLDLNGFEVYTEVASTGISVSNGLSSVTIKNGTARSDSTNGTTGIFIDTASDVVIENVCAKGWTISGIEMNAARNSVVRSSICNENNIGCVVTNGSNEIILQDILSVANSSHGIHVSSSTDTKVQNCTTNSNGGSGLLIDGSANNGSVTGLSSFRNTDSGIRLVNSNSITFENCVVGWGDSDGIYMQTVYSMVFLECVSQDNNGSGVLTAGGSSFNLTFNGCVSNDNANAGFSLSDPTSYNSFTACKAIGNGGDGFLMGDINANLNIIQACQSLNNVGYGFRDLEGAGLNRYYNNVAYRNTAGNSFATVGAFTAPFLAPSSGSINAISNIAG